MATETTNPTDPNDEAMPLGQLRDQQAHEVLDVIRSALKLDDPLVLDDENRVFFTINEKFVFFVYFDYGNTHDMSFSLPLGFLPNGPRREDLLANLMGGNFNWNMTADGVIGLDDETGCVTLTRVVSLPMEDNDQITDIVGTMISIGEYWMEQIAEAHKDDGPSGQGGSDQIVRG